MVASGADQMAEDCVDAEVSTDWHVAEDMDRVEQPLKLIYSLCSCANIVPDTSAF